MRWEGERGTILLPAWCRSAIIADKVVNPLKSAIARFYCLWKFVTFCPVGLSLSLRPGLWKCEIREGNPRPRWEYYKRRTEEREFAGKEHKYLLIKVTDEWP